MALAGIELRYITEHITRQTQDYYTSNIYGIDRDTILFKLHHPQNPDILLVLSTSGIWITSSRIKQIEENRLVRRLRTDLLRLRLKGVEQASLERIAYMRFEGFDKDFVLVGEFFGGGNIILCNGDKKVLALQHSIEVRHRSLAVGQEYVPPPGNALDATNMALSDFDKMAESPLGCARWLGRNLGLPRRYAEEIPRRAGVGAGAASNALNPDQIRMLYDSARNMVNDVISGNHAPTIRKEEGEAYPIYLGEHQDSERVDSFMAGLDHVLTRNILESGRQMQGGQASGEAESLNDRIKEQQKAIETVQRRAAAIGGVADSLYTILSQGILRLDDSGAQRILSQNGAVLERQKGVPVLRILDESIPIDLDASLHSTASKLYVESKRQAGAVKSIEKAIKKTRQKMGQAAEDAKRIQQGVVATTIRKRHWFERYRWFFTSDGALAIGGRDAPSNSAVVRKHMEEGDCVFHAQIFGSPFFILKGKEPTNKSLEEAAQATVCFSRAWREGLWGADSYWVNPNQVKKSAPSGQYLPKGSFTIEGQRNFVRAGNMRLAVGIMQYEGDKLLACGPPDAVASHSDRYVVIEPGGYDISDAAKRIRLEFLRMNHGRPGGGSADQYTIDDYTRILPAGKSHIVQTHDP